MTHIDPVLTQAASAISGRPGTVLVVADGPDRPDLVLIDRQAGLYAIDLDPDGTAPDDRRPWVALNRKRAELRETLSGLGEPAIGAAVVLGTVRERLISSSTLSANRIMLSRQDITDPDWPDHLPRRAIADADYSAIVDRLVPSVVFSRHARTGATDPGTTDRAATRLQLDAAQAAAALAPISDVAVVTGPPGSGKTLLLAARARELHRVHPDWQVTILVFIRALVPYVTRLVNDPAVTVTTMGKFAHQLGFRISLRDSEEAAQDLRKAQQRGIPRINDALLVDELQDFDPAWLQFALATVRLGKGGALLVGDQAQGLYRDGDPSATLSGHDIVRYELTRPYRSTKQVLSAAVAVTRQRVVGIDGAPDGEPVDLIWADSKDAQLDCVTWEISTMLATGQRQPNDIAILLTQWRGVSKLRTALINASIPFEVFDKNNALEFDPTTPTVKVITVHSGKGYEFPVVFLVGVHGDNFDRRRGRVEFQRVFLVEYLERNVAVGQRRAEFAKPPPLGDQYRNLVRLPAAVLEQRGDFPGHAVELGVLRFGPNQVYGFAVRCGVGPGHRLSGQHGRRTQHLFRAAIRPGQRVSDDVVAGQRGTRVTIPVQTLCLVADQQRAAPVGPDRGHREPQPGRSEVLHLVDQQRVDRPRNPAFTRSSVIPFGLFARPSGPSGHRVDARTFPSWSR